MQIVIMLSSQVPCYLTPVRYKCLPQLPIVEYPQPRILRQCQFRAYIKNKQNCSYIYIYILIFILFDSKLEDRKSWSE